MFLLIDPCVEATISPITRYLTLGTLVLLILWEFLQFLSKAFTCEILEYFSWQNVLEAALLGLSSACFVVEFIMIKSSKDCGTYSGLQMHLLGWALFLAWIDLTLFLGRFDVFGKHIYRSWHVMKNVAWSMIVYVPILLAFAFAFHCFLKNDEIFEGTTASILKVFTMVLGEFYFEDHYVYDKVKETNGSQFSVQIMFVMFMIYGGMIIVNLITAWIVVNQKNSDTERILAKQRIQEISGMTKMFAYCSDKKGSINVPSTLHINSIKDSKDLTGCLQFFQFFHDLKRWLLDFSFDTQMLRASTLWEIKTDDNESPSDSILRKVPPLAPDSLIDLTLARLAMKKKKRLELMECIKQIQHKKGYKTCGRCLQPVPEGFKLEYIGLKQGLFQERRKVDFRLRNAAFRAFVWSSNLFCFPQQRFAEKILVATVP